MRTFYSPPYRQAYPVPVLTLVVSRIDASPAARARSSAPARSRAVTASAVSCDVASKRGATALPSLRGSSRIRDAFAMSCVTGWVLTPCSHRYLLELRKQAGHQQPPSGSKRPYDVAFGYPSEGDGEIPWPGKVKAGTDPVVEQQGRRQARSQRSCRRCAS